MIEIILILSPGQYELIFKYRSFYNLTVLIDARRIVFFKVRGDIAVGSQSSRRLVNVSGKRYRQPIIPHGEKDSNIG